MRWLRALWRSPGLDGPLAAQVAAWRALERPGLDVAFPAARAVVVDVESSGLRPYEDRLISIGAVAVRDGMLQINERFETILRQERPSDHANILVHRIGGSRQMAGREVAEGLAEFLAFAGKDPLVAFHADFDRVMIERATGDALGVEPESAWLDLALLAPAVFPDRARTARVLDDWLHAFGIEIHDRHDALADALATGQLLLAVLAAAEQQGVKTWRQLARLQKDQRWLGTSGSV